MRPCAIKAVLQPFRLTTPFKSVPACCLQPSRSAQSGEEAVMNEERNVAVARASYNAYVTKDRSALERLIADDFHFTSPLDNRISRATYFERCWPNSERTASSTSSTWCRLATVCS